MARLGHQQLRLLTVLGTPASMLVVGDALSDSLVKRGLLREDEPRRGIVVTPAGLRVLADELEAGRVKDVLVRMRADKAKQLRKTRRKERTRK